MTNTNITIEPSDELWNEQKTKLKAKFPYLTDADLYYQKGKQFSSDSTFYNRSNPSLSI